MNGEIAEELVRAALAEHPREETITLLAVSVSHIQEQPAIQLELPLGLPDEKCRRGARQGIARWSSDRAMDAVRVTQSGPVLDSQQPRRNTMLP